MTLVDPGCCTACSGFGGTLSGPCSDCYGTGHCHLPDLSCSTPTPPEEKK